MICAITLVWRQISSFLRVASPPAGFIAVSGGWLGSLVFVLALDLPLQIAYFLKECHGYFKSLGPVLLVGMLT